ncbi:MAG TPA: TPM domain-containing protein [Spirochaetota bacterium]|nr:TPM domain-containing protein [Spirochaetota bacterium]HRZ26933.1 TPM domain-containing protein [Spirochaetota bacterium]HSA15926.1 TPM domain-containing protein [Spirochaetota bacterium]
MRDLAAFFLSDEQKKRIESAVHDAERKTSGEIVPMVVSSSYHYPVSDFIGALVLSVLASVAAMLFMKTENMWVFLGLFMPLFVVMHWIVRRTPFLKRLFISDREIDEEVEEAAIKNFFTKGLYCTRDQTGVLIFISVFEHRVWVLADKGINSVVDPKTWNEIVVLITDGIKKKNQADAIVRAVERVGEILSRHFPRKDDDSDELKNLIVDR